MSIIEVFVLNYSTTTQQSTQNSSSLSPQHDHTWLDGLNSPLIQDEGDNKMLKLRFDVSQYTPEEIVVKTVDNKLLVSETFVVESLREKYLNRVYFGHSLIHFVKKNSKIYFKFTKYINKIFNKIILLIFSDQNLSLDISLFLSLFRE